MISKTTATGRHSNCTDAVSGALYKVTLLDGPVVGAARQLCQKDIPKFDRRAHPKCYRIENQADAILMLPVGRLRFETQKKLRERKEEEHKSWRRIRRPKQRSEEEEEDEVEMDEFTLSP